MEPHRPAADRFCGIQGQTVRRREHLLLLPVVRRGRFWIEGLRTDSLYLSDWTIAGQPIRVSQVLSLVLMIAALAVLF